MEFSCLIHPLLWVTLGGGEGGGPVAHPVYVAPLLTDASVWVEHSVSLQHCNSDHRFISQHQSDLHVAILVAEFKHIPSLPGDGGGTM